MTNGNNDWQPPQEGADDVSEAELREKSGESDPPPEFDDRFGGDDPEGSDGAEGFEVGTVGSGRSNRHILEGWGGGGATIGEVISNAGKAFGQFRGPLLTAWLLLWGALLATTVSFEGIQLLVEGGGQGMQGELDDAFTALESIAYSLVVAAQMTLYGPFYRIWRGGEPPLTWFEALGENIGRFWWLLLAFFLLSQVVSWGCCCCFLPGLLLAPIGSMTPYLLATRPNLAFDDAIEAAYILTKRYWSVFYPVMIVSVLMVVTLFCCSGLSVGMSFEIQFGLSPTVVTGVAILVGLSVAQLAGFFLWTGLFVTVDQKEGFEF